MYGAKREGQRPRRFPRGTAHSARTFAARVGAGGGAVAPRQRRRRACEGVPRTGGDPRGAGRSAARAGGAVEGASARGPAAQAKRSSRPATGGRSSFLRAAPAARRGRHQGRPAQELESETGGLLASASECAEARAVVEALRELRCRPKVVRLPAERDVFAVAGRDFHFCRALLGAREAIWNF